LPHSYQLAELIEPFLLTRLGALHVAARVICFPAAGSVSTLPANPKKQLTATEH